MADYTYEQLKDMTVVQIREIAKDIVDPSLEGYRTMHKDQLLPIVCKLLNIHMHHAAAGGEKTKIKATIHKLQAKRDDANTPPEQEPMIRHQIHVLKRRLRRMIPKAA